MHNIIKLTHTRIYIGKAHPIKSITRLEFKIKNTFDSDYIIGCKTV